MNYFSREMSFSFFFIILSWSHFSEMIFSEDIEMQFIERIQMTIRASCFASIPLLGNMIVIPLLILLVEKCQKRLNLIEDKHQYEKFLDININLIRDHFHALLLFEINIFALAVMDNTLCEHFQGKCFLFTAIFFISRFMHIYQTVFSNSMDFRAKNYQLHLITLGENISLMLNIILMIINVNYRMQDG